ncbi:SPFH domain-containing protein [Neokomagataea thailandica NBRC 106555]|nr:MULTISPECIES: SPFH domain-containing protein [Neokomagataea]GBR53647.1 SPFH domain-containing protein [Neokomagataea thailandica NBRC 106555]
MAYVCEVLGKPQRRPLKSGLNFTIPFITTISYKISLQQRQVETLSEVKTKDDVFIEIRWVLLYSVRDDDDAIFNFAYKVTEPVKRLVFKVENEIRQISSTMTLSELYSQRNAIASQVIADQTTDALESGLDIHNVTIEQPMPPKVIQEAMNNKLAAIARKDAAQAEADAEMVRRLGIAKAEAMSKQLQGEGIANERKAIAKGFAEAAATLRSSMTDASEDAILALMLNVNQNDMVTTASRTGKATVIFVPTDMNMQNITSTSAGRFIPTPE